MIDEMRKGFELPVTAAADVGEVSVGLNRQEGVAEEDERVGGGGGRDVGEVGRMVLQGQLVGSI